MMQGRRRRLLTGYLFLVPYLSLFVGFLLLPLGYGLGLSLFRWEMLSPASPRLVGLANFREAMGDDYFWKATWATLRFSLMCVPASIVVALAVAVGIQSLPRRWHGFFRASYFLPSIISISVAAILWRWFYHSEFGLFNAYLEPFGLKAPWISDADWAMPSLVLMTLWWTTGAPMVILLAGLQNIPDHYYEAAAIDGAGGARRFWNVTLPLLKPVLLFATVMSTIGSFQVFGQPFLITRGGPELSTRVLVQYIYETAFQNYRMGYGSAMSWLLFLMIAAVSLVQFRVLRERRA